MFSWPPVSPRVEACLEHVSPSPYNGADTATVYNERKITLYNQGDTISHPCHGLGTIKAFENKEILGNKREFAVLYFPHEQLNLSVLKKELHKQVREIVTEDEAFEILEYLSNFEEKLTKNWKMRNHNNKERLTSGDPRELCEVAMGLMRMKSRREKPLSRSDRKQLQEAFRLLAEELGSVLDEETPAMEYKLREACLDSLAA